MARVLLGSDLKAYVLEATTTWHVQHEFSKFLLDTKITLSRGMQQKFTVESLAPGLYLHLAYVNIGLDWEACLQLEPP